MTYDDELARVLDSITVAALAYVSVKGHHISPQNEDDWRILRLLAHHTETRFEIEELRDMLNEVLKNSKASETVESAE